MIKGVEVGEVSMVSEGAGNTTEVVGALTAGGSGCVMALLLFAAAAVVVVAVAVVGVEDIMMLE